MICHTLDLLAEIVSEDEISDLDIFDKSLLTGGIAVGVTRAYDKVEIVTVSTGSGLTTEQDAKITFMRDWMEADEEKRDDTYRRLHKDTKAPLVSKDVSKSGNDVDLTEPV